MHSDGPELLSFTDHADLNFVNGRTPVIDYHDSVLAVVNVERERDDPANH